MGVGWTSGCRYAHDGCFAHYDCRYDWRSLTGASDACFPAAQGGAGGAGGATANDCDYGQSQTRCCPAGPDTKVCPTDAPYVETCADALATPPGCVDTVPSMYGFRGVCCATP